MAHRTHWINGKPWTGSLESIPLKSRAEVQLDVGKPVVAFQGISWDASGL